MQYLGGKSRIAGWVAYEATAILDRYRLTTFVDLFAGACNVISRIDSRFRRIANDTDRAIMVTMESSSMGYQFPEDLTEEEYRVIKSTVRETDPLYGFAAYGCSFTGKRWGGYARNVGGYNYARSASRSLSKKGAMLKGVEFRVGDYSAFAVPGGSLIYCDIPYHGTTGYHGNFNHDDFYGWVQRQKNPVLISEYADSFNPLMMPMIASVPSARQLRGRNGRAGTVECLRLWVPTDQKVYLG